MTFSTLLILCAGLLAMSGSLGVAWWMWTRDPLWPWTRPIQAPAPNPTRARHAGPQPTLGSQTRVPAQPIPTPVIMPAPDHADPSDEAEDASTKFFIKGASPDKTQILPDRHELMGFERDPDAPVAVDEDLLKTTPNLRAAPIPRPPRH